VFFFCVAKENEKTKHVTKPALWSGRVYAMVYAMVGVGTLAVTANRFTPTSTLYVDIRCNYVDIGCNYVDNYWR